MIFAYRSSLQPFKRVNANAIIREWISCTDGYWGKFGLGTDSYSIQLNVNTTYYWIQNVVCVRNGFLEDWIVETYDMNQNVKSHYSPANIPPIPLKLINNAVALTFDTEVQDNEVKIIARLGLEGYNPKGFVLPITDPMYCANLEIVGFLGGSNSYFTSGSFDCSINFEDTDDLVTDTGIPNIAINKFGTAETSNLVDTIQQTNPIEVKLMKSLKQS